MSDQPDPDVTIRKPPAGPPDPTGGLPAAEPSAGSRDEPTPEPSGSGSDEPTAPATVIDTGAGAPTIGAPPAAPSAPAPPPAPSTIAPFPSPAPTPGLAPSTTEPTPGPGLAPSTTEPTPQPGFPGEAGAGIPGAAPPAASGFGGVPATPVVPVTEPPKRSGGRALPWVIAAVFAVAAVGLGIWGVGQQGNASDRDDTIDQLRTQNDDLDAQLTALKEGQDSVQDGLDEANATASSLAAELATAQSDLATAESDLATRQADLDAAAAQIADLEAQLSAATSTTLPPEPEPTDPTADDGIISEDEFAAVTQAFGTIIPPGFTIEQAQDIANQACAAPDTDSLQAALENITQMYIPSGNPVDAGLVTGGIAGFACSTHLQTLTGG